MKLEKPFLRIAKTLKPEVDLFAAVLTEFSYPGINRGSVNPPFVKREAWRMKSFDVVMFMV